MQTELFEMRRTLAAIFAKNHTLRQAVREVNKMDIIKASLIARTPKHQELRIDRIMDGEFPGDVAIGDCIFIQNCQELLNTAYNNLEMGNYMNVGLIRSAYRILADNPEGNFRKDNPVVYTFSHVPPDFEDVEDRLRNSFSMVYGNRMDDDIVARAMYMHNCIIDIWPFDKFNGELAIFAMNYYLMEQGFMPIDMPMKKEDYQELVSACLKGRRPDEEYAFFADAIKEKMAGTIEACRSYV